MVEISLPSFGDRYRSTRVIASGAAGTVYEAEDPEKGRVVAIKLLDRAYEATNTRRQRFLREAAILAEVNHPNVVEVYDSGFDERGRPYLVMELVDGPSMATMLRDGPFTLARACRLTRLLLDALEAAHEVGVLHRDIKPENLMIVPRPEGYELKLVDFGVSRRFGSDLDHITEAGMATGTAAYMAPEQVMALPIGPWTDVYAVGCTLYEMLVARPPFSVRESGGVAGLFRRIAQTDAPLISALRPGVPPALEALVQRALSRIPAARFQTCAEMRGAIQALEGTFEEDDLSLYCGEHGEHREHQTTSRPIKL